MEINQALDHYTFFPLVAERWNDFEALFGPRGACAGCWCMWWKLSRKDFTANQGEGNRKAISEMVHGGQIPGILAYHGDTPVGWIAIEPRENYRALEHSRVLKRPDPIQVWSITCFFIHKHYRNRGLMSALIEAAIKYAANQGAINIEAYPIDPLEEKVSNLSIFTGHASTFRAAGFVEVARNSPKRPIMRYTIRNKD